MTVSQARGVILYALENLEFQCSIIPQQVKAPF